MTSYAGPTPRKTAVTIGLLCLGACTPQTSASECAPDSDELALPLASYLEELSIDPEAAGDMAQLRCLVRMHPDVDSTNLSASGTTLMIRNARTGEWSNVLLGETSTR